MKNRTEISTKRCRTATWKQKHELCWTKLRLNFTWS